VTLLRKRRRFTAKEKRQIVREGLRSDCKVAELCRREGISTAQYYTWARLYDEFGLRGFEGEIREAASRSEVQALQRENQQRGGTPDRIGRRFAPSSVAQLPRQVSR